MYVKHAMFADALDNGMRMHVLSNYLDFHTAKVVGRPLGWFEKRLNLVRIYIHIAMCKIWFRLDNILCLLVAYRFFNKK